MRKQGKNKRRNYFIDKSFQSRFIIKFCFIVVLASLLTGILIYYFNRQTTTVAFEDLKVVVKSTADFILPITLEIIVIVSLLVAIAVGALTLFTSHKIAGPLYKLKMELEKISNGDLSSPIRIRAKDQLQKIASEFNEMRIGLKNSISEIKINWDSIKTDLYKLREEIKDEERKRKIEDNIKKIDSELARFKID